MRYPGLALSVLTIALLQGCGERDLSPEQKAYVATLEAELAKTKSEVDTSSKASSAYVGGLIKSLVDARLEILKTNQALLEQRILAVRSGGGTKIETTTSKPDEQLAAQLATEIAQLKANIQAAQAEAARYSGGLIQAMKLSAIATQEQTLAMLEQRYLVAKYGLYGGLNQASIPQSTAQSPARAQVAESNPPADRLPPGAGPFGLEIGLPKDTIEKMIGEALVVANEAQNLYSTTGLPKSNEAFEQYALVISPTVGLCQIRALGKNIATNGYGHQLKGEYDGLKTSLSSVYGSPKTYDFLMPGSIWKNPDDWMMGLKQNDRSLMAEWTSKSASPLKNDLKQVIMEARALSSDKGYIFLQYSFSNDPQCDAEREKKKTDSL